MISNRPSFLRTIPNYTQLPKLPIGIEVEHFPEMLRLDLFIELVGLAPSTKELSDLQQGGMTIRPPKCVVEYYKERQTEFQMIFVVANCCIFRECEGVMQGYPYSLTLFPASKRDRLETQIAGDYFLEMDFENLAANFGMVYWNFDPFAGEWDLCGEASVFLSSAPNEYFTDSLGFVIGIYFLATDVDLDDVIMTGLPDAPPELRRKYYNFRRKRYFTPFKDLRPRRLWGTESPIELFLMQGLVHRGHAPVPQYLIYGSGQAYPSLHDLCLDHEFANDSDLLTSADLYFPEQRVAVFCDSTTHHRSKEARERDEKINARLGERGIAPVRVSGRQIVRDLESAINAVEVKL